MTRSSRGSAFWVFIFGLAFGAALGAVLTHKYLSEHPERLARSTPTSPAPTPVQPAPAHEDTFQRILREWHLTPEDIRRQLDRAGQVIKREGGALGERLGDATLDARIVTVIKAKFTLDPELSAWEIAVSSKDGHVTLGGTVSHQDLVVRAVVLALDTGGVVDVNSTLRVAADAPAPSPPVERPH